MADSAQSPDEQRLLAAYRNLPREKKELLKLYLAMLAQYDVLGGVPVKRERYDTPGLRINFAAIPNLNRWKNTSELMGLVASGAVQKEPEEHVTHLRFAGLDVRVRHRHRYFDMSAEGYLAPPFGDPDIDVEVGEKDVAAVRADLEEGFTDDYLETLAIHGLVAERLPQFDRMVFHGAVVAYRGAGYLFAAPSGTGKTTHVALWRRHLGRAVTVVNGDKPILHIGTEPGEAVTAYGTPWAGKEHWQENTSVPLRALCLVSRGDSNAIRKVDPGECVDRVLAQAHLPEDARMRLKTIDLLDRMLGALDVYELTCDMKPEAAQCSFEALTGEPWGQGIVDKD